jgi:hypothetical protein
MNGKFLIVKNYWITIGMKNYKIVFFNVLFNIFKKKLPSDMTTKRR